MTVRRPLAALFVVPVVLTTGVLAGCGVTETALRPGVAVEVGDEVVTVKQVDEVADGLCEVLKSDPAFDGRHYRTSSLRNAALRGLTLGVMADQISAEYDVPLPAGDFGADQVALQFGQAEADDLEAAMPAFTGDQKIRAVLVALGRDELGARTEENEAITAGVERAQEWQQRTDVDTNPAFEALSIGDTAVEAARDDLSVAVSDFAKTAADPAAQEAGSDPGELPESQRCSG